MTESVLAVMTERFLAERESPTLFAWQGGEPTLAGIEFYRIALELQRRFARAGQSVANTFQTNGMLIDDAWADFPVANRFLVGLSIDGPAHLHNAIRQSPTGHSSHAAAVRAWRLLRERGCEVNVLCVVSQHNADQARVVYQYLTDQLGAQYIQFIPCIRPAAIPGAEGELPSRGYGRFLAEVFDLWAAETRPVSVKLFDDFVLHLAGSPMRDCMHRPTCDSHLVVERDGSVYPCDFFVAQQYRLGSIIELEVGALRATEKAVAFRCRKEAERPLACRSCPHLDLCQGGCARFWRQNEPGAWTQELCQDMRFLLDYCRPRLEEMAAAVRARWRKWESSAP